MIAFQSVFKVYNSRSVALEDINIRINPGEFVSLVGRSGAGKSTAIKLLTGGDKPTKGRIFFGQYEVNKLKDDELPSFFRTSVFYPQRMLLKMWLSLWKPPVGRRAK